MTQHPLDFMYEQELGSSADTEYSLEFPEINYIAFDDYQEVVTQFYASQEQMRAELPRTKVPADLISAWDRAKSVR
jgi:hypothetical protein